MVVKKLTGRVDVGRLVKTPIFQKAQATAHSLVRNAGIGLFYGKPGLGKTVVAKLFLDELGDRPQIYLAAAAHPTLPAFARDVASQLTGIRDLENDRLYSLTRMLREVLWSRLPAVLVIDEAQRLSLNHFEFLRDLHDHEDAAFALLFVGNDHALEVINQRPMLKSRMLHIVHFEPLSPTDVLTFLPGFHPLFSSAAPVLLRAVAHASIGNFRWLGQFTVIAEDIAEKHHITTLDESLYRATMSLMAGEIS